MSQVQLTTTPTKVPRRLQPPGPHYKWIALSNTTLGMLMGYMLLTATLVVSLGRISDMFGRVRLYNMGFAIFSVGSILLYVTPGSGDAAAIM